MTNDAKGATVAKINKALRALGTETRLVRGEGYWYFSGGDAEMWYAETGVYGVTTVASMSVESWVGIYQERQAEYERMRMPR